MIPAESTNRMDPVERQAKWVTPPNEIAAPIKVRLDQIVTESRHCIGRPHPTMLTEAAVLPLMYSIPFEKRPVPVAGFFETGRFLLLDGHRRIMAIRLLVEKRVPGYFGEMAIHALELARRSGQGDPTALRIHTARPQLTAHTANTWACEPQQD